MKELDEHSYFDFLQADHSLSHFFQSGITTYLEMLNICQENNIVKVYDVGCGYGWQSEIFLRGGVKYTGIEVAKHTYWKENMTEDINYINKEYPFKIDSKSNEAVVSNMCISWNCYLKDSDTLEKQVNAISRDFNQAILYLSKDRTKYFINEFKCCKVLQDDTFSKFVYLKKED
ncbi:MAG: hypothetical protein ACOCRO_00555 [Halanaerobiales bacterium]